MLINKKSFAKSIVALSMVTTSAWAADGPIGELVSQGKVTVTGNGMSVVITDDRYAYFPGDMVRTDDQARAAIVTNDGVRIRFSELSAGRVLFLDGVYNIDRIDGQITLEADSGVPYQVLDNGKPISEARLFSDGDPVVIAASYMPAQLSDAQIQALMDSGSFTADEIEALKKATANMSQEELANMTDAQLRELLPPEGSSGGLSTGAKVGIAAAIIVGAAIIINDDDDDDDDGGDSGSGGGEDGGGEVVVPPPPPPPSPRPPSGGSSTPDTPDDEESGS